MKDYLNFGITRISNQLDFIAKIWDNFSFIVEQIIDEKECVIKSNELFSIVTVSRRRTGCVFGSVSLDEYAGL
jgi:hypothetical protein